MSVVSPGVLSATGITGFCSREKIITVELTEIFFAVTGLAKKAGMGRYRAKKGNGGYSFHPAKFSAWFGKL